MFNKHTFRQFLNSARNIDDFYHPWINFSGDFSTWEEAQKQCDGYSKQAILDKVKAATQKVISGEAACERDSVTFHSIQYSWPALSGLLYAAALSAGKLNVLDFGGSLGSSYFQNHKFLAGLDYHWSIVEQAHFCECGKALIGDRKISFHSSVEECVSTHQPNTVLLSSTLQYLEEPYHWLEKLCQINAPIIIMDRTSFSSNSREMVKIQSVPKAIYQASYPFWVLSREKVISCLNASGYQIIEVFDAPFVPRSRNIQFQGLIAKKCISHDNKTKRTP